MQTFRDVELTVLRALAIGFHLPEEYFLQFHTVAENQLRLLRYPRCATLLAFTRSFIQSGPSVPTQRLKNEEVTRIGAHSDFGSITLLLQDDVGGLEVEDPNETGHFNASGLRSCRLTPFLKF